jgi:hypothetical protein
VEFDVGLKVDFEKTDPGSDTETLTTFSVPIGIRLSF